MRPLTSLLAVLASGFIYSTPAFAQVTAASDPVGFTTTSLLGESDTLISIPFTRPPEFTGAIQTASGTTITAVGTPGWTANQFVYVAGSQPKHYYALIGNGGSSNPKEGHFYPITANGANTLTVTTTAANDLTGITANTQVTIIPYWTLATAFPPGDANVSFTPTSSVPTYKTQIEIADDSAPTISYSIVYYFDAATSKWRVVSVADPDRGDDVLSPDSFFVVRNQNGAPTLPLTALGSVLMKKLSAPLMTSAGQAYENAVTMLRPIDVPLNATGLKPSDGSFIANDQLLLFDNSQVGINKTPSATYFYDALVGDHGGWRLSGELGANDHGSDIIPAGSAMIVRKAQTGGGTAFWTNGFPVKAVSAYTPKIHNTTPTTTTFNLTLSLSGVLATNPLIGVIGVEPRLGGGASFNTHQVVFNFPGAVTVTGTPQGKITSGTGTVANSGNVTINGSTVTVDVTAVANAQRMMVTLIGVNDGANTYDVAVPMGVLLADVNASHRVDSNDVFQIRTLSLVALDNTTFQNDVDLSGRIDSNDVFQSRQQSQTGF